MPTKAPKRKFNLIDSIMKIKTNYILGFLLVLAAFLIGVLYTKVVYLEKGTTTTATSANTQVGQPAAAGYALGSKVDLGKNDLPILGNKNAKVQIEEFADFQCPYCEKWFQEIQPSFIKDYVNTGKVSFAFRHFAFLDQSTDPAGPESTQAANASECANEQGKFWEYHDYLYKNQGQEDGGTFAIDNLKTFATTLGLNTDQFNSCLDAKKYQSVITSDMNDAQKAGVNGTPVTFINGKMMQYGGDSAGALPYDQFKKFVDDALKAAK